MSKVSSNMETHFFQLKINHASHTENNIIYAFAIYFLSALVVFGAWWRSYLLVPRHWIHQLHIKLRVILSKRLIAVMVDQFHDWIKRQWIRKAVFPISMVDLYQFVVATLPVKWHSHLEVLHLSLFNTKAANKDTSEIPEQVALTLYTS